MSLTIVIVSIPGIVISVYVLSPMKIKSNFDHQLAALSSVIGTEQRNTVISRWSYMETKSDYEKTTRDLDELFKENSLTKPASRW